MVVFDLPALTCMAQRGDIITVVRLVKEEDRIDK